MFFAFSLWIGFLFVLPLFLQQLLGLTAFQSGLATSPQAVGWIAMSTVASRIYAKLGPKKMIVSGLTGTTLMTLLFVTITAGTSLWLIRLILFFRGLSMAFAVIPIQVAVFINIPMKEIGRASSIFNTNRQVAASFGTAILGAVLFELLLSRQNTSTDQFYAYRVAFIAATILGIAAITIAFTIRAKDAEASLKHKKDIPAGE
jgi:MFS family permease